MTAGQFEDLAGCRVLDAQGSTVGTVSQVYISDATGQPSWVVVRADADESGGRFAPLAGSEIRSGHLVLAVPARMVSDSPRPTLDSMGHLSPADSGMLSRHYDRPGTETGPEGIGPDADAGMTLSEERLRVGTERVVSGRARLVKYVVTEEVTLTVLVAREEVRVELEPAATGEDQPSPGAGAGAGAGAGGERAPGTGNTGGSAEGWMILHAERPVVQLESVPVERVRLRVETVAGQQEITGQVRREQIGAPDVDIFPAAP